MKYKFFLVFVGIILGLLLASFGGASAEQIKSVLVENFPTLQNVNVVNTEALNVATNQKEQRWVYFYQCHPNPTNESEIRNFLNGRGNEGWEVVAAAGVSGLICEYYKAPKTE